MSAPEQRKPAQSLFLETLAETRKVYPSEKVQHEKFGVGFRFRFGETTCTFYRPTGKTPRAEVVTPDDILRKTGVTAIKLVAAEEGEAFEGILITSPRGSVWVKPDGSYSAEHSAPVPQTQPQELHAPGAPQKEVASSRKAGRAATPSGETGRVEEKPSSVTVFGFYEKVMDGFPRETGTTKKRTVYKFLIGNYSEIGTKADGSPKIDWTTVVASEPAAVTFLQENLANIQTHEPRTTILEVKGNYQEVSRRSGNGAAKKAQELYALSISFKENTK